MTQPLVLAITGASGAVYARRLLHILLEHDHVVHLAISPSAKQVFQQELGVNLDLQSFQLDKFLGVDHGDQGQVVYHRHDNVGAAIASGSFRTSGMVICPCSGATLSGVAHGTSSNLIQRAADVHLKERRKLILVPRETPLSLIHIDNMKRVTEAGGIILPANPGWYHEVRSLDDLVDFVVARILDVLGLEIELMKRWGKGVIDR